MEDPKLWAMILGSVFGSAGGVWIGFKMELRNLKEDVNEAKQIGREAHKRIDTMLVK